MKCENGNARLELYFDQLKDGNLVSSPTRNFSSPPRKSRNSPSTLRRSRARAEAYQLKKSLFETKKEESVLDTSSTQKVFVPEVIPVAEANTTYVSEFGSLCKRVNKLKIISFRKLW